MDDNELTLEQWIHKYGLVHQPGRIFSYLQDQTVHGSTWFFAEEEVEVSRTPKVSV